MNIKKILLPVDDSVYSMHSTKYAVELVKSTGAEVVLMTCYTPNLMLWDDYYGMSGILTESMSKEMEIRLKRYRQVLSESGIFFKDKIVKGETVASINKQAEEENCDLILMGSRGHSDFEGLMLGSVTHRVLQTASVPVLVVR
jgi:nucleotide-binding universal stress UspA family protein